MIEAFSTRNNKFKSLILIVICGLSAAAAAAAGINDNLVGVLLALLAAVAFVLAFAHPWRITRKFLFLLLASVLGFILFIVVNILVDSFSQNPTSSPVLLNLMQSPAGDAVSLVFLMLCAAAFIVGAVGSILFFIRGRRQKA